MKSHTSRRTFLKRSAAASLSVPLVRSLEEYALAEQQTSATPTFPPACSKGTVPMGKIGNVQISRLICGGNLISGYAHSRDLIYVSPLLKHYFSDEKVMETWSLCEQHGVNTMILHPSNAAEARLYEKYRARGGKIQYLAQIAPKKDEIATEVKKAKDAGAIGAFLLGNFSDEWSRDGDIKTIGEFLAAVKKENLICGVAGHEVRSVMAVEKAGLGPDFYMKTLHSENYWSKRRPDQLKDVIDNYGVDNYWCKDPKETVAFMSEVRRPWIAYKVLAAGAIHPKVGFKHAFDSGADFVAVGMFDFQIAENGTVINEVVKVTQNRDREWFA